jgi:periplasmic divalent cation tolerance protein
MTSIGYVTARDRGEAEKIAKCLLKKRLIACANIIPEVRSLYRWKGRLNDGKETLIMIKL